MKHGYINIEHVSSVSKSKTPKKVIFNGLKIVVSEAQQEWEEFVGNARIRVEKQQQDMDGVIRKMNDAFFNVTKQFKFRGDLVG